jgi:hypothetical protein
MRCRFGAAATRLAQARADDNIDARAAEYAALRRHVDVFYRVLERSEKRLSQDRLADLKVKLASLLVWDFEAAVWLRKWDGLGEIVRRARMCRSAAAFKEMADCLVRHREVAPGGESLGGGPVVRRREQMAVCFEDGPFRCAFVAVPGQPRRREGGGVLGFFSHGMRHFVLLFHADGRHDDSSNSRLPHPHGHDQRDLAARPLPPADAGKV